MEVKRPEVLGLHFQKAGDSFKAAGAFVFSGIIVSQLLKKKDPKISNIIGFGLGGVGSILIIKGGVHLYAVGVELQKKPK